MSSDTRRNTLQGMKSKLKNSAGEKEKRLLNIDFHDTERFISKYKKDLKLKRAQKKAAEMLAEFMALVKDFPIKK